MYVNISLSLSLSLSLCNFYQDVYREGLKMELAVYKQVHSGSASLVISTCSLLPNTLGWGGLRVIPYI